jgi:hypothetical protein
MSYAMKVVTVLAIVSPLIFGATQLQAESRGWSFFLNSKQLYERCLSANDRDRGWCDGYIAGVVDAYGGTDDPQWDAVQLEGCFQKSVSLSVASAKVRESSSGCILTRETSSHCSRDRGQ